MVCPRWCSPLCPLIHFLCAILFTHSVKLCDRVIEYCCREKEPNVFQVELNPPYCSATHKTSGSCCSSPLHRHHPKTWPAPHRRRTHAQVVNTCKRLGRRSVRQSPCRGGSWLPDGDSQILRLYAFGPSGFLDYGSATLRCKI